MSVIFLSSGESTGKAIMIDDELGVYIATS